MTVKELIKILNQTDENLKVYLTKVGGEDSPLLEVGADNNGIYLYY